MRKAIRIFSLIMTIVIIGSFYITAFAETKVVARGIDVSYWQTYPNGVRNEIDFAKVKASGIDFVILRVGTSGGKDSTFDTNYTNAKNAGLDVGCYFYTYAKTPEASLTDAQNVVKWIGNRELEYPVYFDIEDSSLEPLSKDAKMSIIKSFIDHVSSQGFYTGIYINPNWLKYHLDSEYIKENYDIWLAHWTKSGEPDVDKSSECRVWQYSAKGSVDGIVGDVDLNVSYFDYPSYIKERGFNNYEGLSEEEIEYKYQVMFLRRVISRLMDVVITLAKLLGLS